MTPADHAATPIATQADEALRRVRDYINRAAGQHSRAVSAQFTAARLRMAGRTAFHPTPWSAKP